MIQRIKIKFIIFIAFILTGLYLQAKAQHDSTNQNLDIQKISKPPSSSEMEEVSPAKPLKKKGEKLHSDFILAEPVIADPREE